MIDPHPRRATVDELVRLDIRVGTVRAAMRNSKARVPALVLDVDFGPLGVKRSSAQITEHYDPETLVGRQVLAATNLEPRRVVGVRSEVLVLAVVCPSRGTVLIGADRAVDDGAPLR